MATYVNPNLLAWKHSCSTGMRMGHARDASQIVLPNWQRANTMTQGTSDVISCRTFPMQNTLCYCQKASALGCEHSPRYHVSRAPAHRNAASSGASDSGMFLAHVCIKSQDSGLTNP